MNHDHHNFDYHTESQDYFLFAAVITGIILVSGAIAYLTKQTLPMDLMRTFMAVFFLVFAIFKLIDLPGFVMSYIGYDLIASRWQPYAYIYPFLELALAAGYFANWFPINYFTVVLMTIGTIGVARQLASGRKIKCACLGTYIKLPLSTVSLTEDLIMGIMALILLIK